LGLTDLNVPFLLLAALTLGRSALALRRAPWVHAREWWLAIACVLLSALITYVFAAGYTGAVAFASALGLLNLPTQLITEANRALRRGAQRRALLLARLAALLHPAAAFRDRPRFFRLILSLRAGLEPDPREIDRFVRVDPELAHVIEIFRAHLRGDLPALRQIFADPEPRARLLAGGFGLAYLRLAGITSSAPEALPVVLGEIERADPTLQSADAAAILTVFFPAYLADAALTRAHVQALRPYLAPGEADAAIAVALARAGDLPAALSQLDRALHEHRRDRYATHLLHVWRRILTEHLAPAPPPTATSARILEKFRHEAEVLATLATLEGRSADRLQLTWSLALALALVYLIVAATGDPLAPDHLYAWGALFTPELEITSAWRLLTSTFLHAGVIHLIFNLIGLHFFGRFVEPFFGHLRAGIIYLAAGGLSGLSVALLADPERPSLLVGASGAIFGLGGAMLAALLSRPLLRATRRGRAQIRGLLILFGLQVVLDLTVAQISSTAHIAGLLVGLALGLLLAPRVRP
jgi:membrane associated rhomboid family serine protease